MEGDRQVNDYNKLIDDLTKKFEMCLPENEDDREILIENFKKYMYFSIDTLEKSKYNIDRSFEGITKILISISASLCEMDIIEKKRKLLKDEKFEEIRRISGDTFRLALQRLTGEKNESISISQNDIESLDNLIKSVKPYNINEAKKLISEAILDWEYLNSENPNIYSIRLHHEILRLKRNEDDKEER